MFYSDKTMHKIYKDEGTFDIIYQIPQMLYSSLLSLLFTNLIGNFGLYEDNILDVRKRKKSKEDLNQIIYDVSRVIKIKVILFLNIF